MILEEGRETAIAPLPLYHIYAFTVHCMVLLETGNHSVLIPNPRDIPGFVKTLQKSQFSAFVGLNTLFVALCNREDFRALDFSGLKLTMKEKVLTHGSSASFVALSTRTPDEPAKSWQ